MMSEIDRVTESINLSKYNARQVKEIETLESQENNNLMNTIKNCMSQVDQTVRDGGTVTCTYDINPYKEKLSHIGIHWQH